MAESKDGAGNSGASNSSEDVADHDGATSVGEAKGAEALRQDLGTEYYAIVKIISEFDGRLMIVKGWSVTLSLAGLGLGFQQGHYALFALAAGTALAFWFIDATMKRHQMRFYPRLRDIEVATFHLNHLVVGGQTISAPRTNWSWTFSDRGRDAPDLPERRTPQETRRVLALAPWLPHVLLPHAIAVVLGLALFVAALLDVHGLEALQP
jgi:hypothetical protein